MLWTPLRRIDGTPEHNRQPDLYKKWDLTEPDEAWVNDRYQVVVRYMNPKDPSVPMGQEGMLHLSIHAHDRGPMRNWRHLQQIKNEVAGPERYAVEVFPGESALVDTTNEYHLWVMPEGETIGFAMDERLVSSDEQAEAYTDDPTHRGRQEPWEEGLTTGEGRNEEPDPRLEAMKGDQHGD